MPILAQDMVKDGCVRPECEGERRNMNGNDKQLPLTTSMSFIVRHGYTLDGEEKRNGCAQPLRLVDRATSEKPLDVSLAFGAHTTRIHPLECLSAERGFHYWTAEPVSTQHIHMQSWKVSAYEEGLDTEGRMLSIPDFLLREFGLHPMVVCSNRSSCIVNFNGICRHEAWAKRRSDPTWQDETVFAFGKCENVDVPGFLHPIIKCFSNFQEMCSFAESSAWPSLERMTPVYITREYAHKVTREQVRRLKRMQCKFFCDLSTSDDPLDKKEISRLRTKGVSNFVIGHDVVGGMYIIASAVPKFSDTSGYTLTFDTFNGNVTSVIDHDLLVRSIHFVRTQVISDVRHRCFDVDHYSAGERITIEDDKIFSAMDALSRGEYGWSVGGVRPSNAGFLDQIFRNHLIVFTTFCASDALNVCALRSSENEDVVLLPHAYGSARGMLNLYTRRFTALYEPIDEGWDLTSTNVMAKLRKRHEGEKSPGFRIAKVSPWVSCSCSRETYFASELLENERLFLQWLTETCEGEGRRVRSVFIETIASDAKMLLRPAFLKGLRKMCDRYNVLIIEDGTMTTWRTCLPLPWKDNGEATRGEHWRCRCTEDGFMHEAIPGYHPDLVVFGKCVGVAGVAVPDVSLHRKALVQQFIGEGGERERAVDLSLALRLAAHSRWLRSMTVPAILPLWTKVHNAIDSDEGQYLCGFGGLLSVLEKGMTVYGLLESMRYKRIFLPFDMTSEECDMLCRKHSTEADTQRPTRKRARPQPLRDQVSLSEWSGDDDDDESERDQSGSEYSYVSESASESDMDALPSSRLET